MTAGLAEIAAGSIAMGLGGYLAARTDADHYDSERPQNDRRLSNIPAEKRTRSSAFWDVMGSAMSTSSLWPQHCGLTRIDGWTS